MKNRDTHLTHALLLPLLGLLAASCRGDIAGLCADRTAIEQVYYEHRLGNKPPFEKALPPALIEELVREDLRKEAALQNVYGVEITPEMLEREVQRINTTTRGPEMLAEIKAALGSDPERFADAFAKPFLVDHLLRAKFANDDAVHAPRRRECEQARNELLAAKTRGARLEELLAQLKQARSNAVTETTWQLGARPEATNAPAADEIEIQNRFGPSAKILSSASGVDADRRFYFEELPSGLQNVLRVQLRQAGDVSAVIETPGGFLLYLAEKNTPESLTVATLSLPKRSYDRWLAEQSKGEE